MKVMWLGQWLCLSVRFSVCLSVSVSVCSTVCQLDKSVINACWWHFVEGWSWPKEELIRFWWWSGVLWILDHSLRFTISLPLGSKAWSDNLYLSELWDGFGGEWPKDHPVKLWQLSGLGFRSSFPESGSKSHAHRVRCVRQVEAPFLPPEFCGISAPLTSLFPKINVQNSSLYTC